MPPKKKTRASSGVIKGSAPSIPPEDTALLQRQMFQIVRENMRRAGKVLSGHHKWGQTEVRLFLAMVDKVVPTVSESITEISETMDIESMSTEEINALLSAEISRRNAPPVDVTPLDMNIGDTPINFAPPPILNPRSEEPIVPHPKDQVFTTRSLVTVDKNDQ